MATPSDRDREAWRLAAPELQATLERLPRFDLNDKVVALARAGRGYRPPPFEEDRGVLRSEHLAPGPDGAPSVRVLVYRPASASVAARPAYLHLHGGGFVVGSPEFDDAPNRMLASELGCVVVSAGYRLAPETRYPGAVEDAYSVLAWLHREADALGIDRRRIAIGGESAGGGLAASLAAVVRDRGEFTVCLQLLDAPMLDDRTGAGNDPPAFTASFLWTPETNRYCWGSYLGVEPGGEQTPDGAVPARLESLAGVAPACIVVGALDLLLEENVEYARRLIRAGVPTELHVISGAFHGFASAGGDAPQIVQLLELKAKALARAFA
jgi:triacylglycerol lipase